MRQIIFSFIILSLFFGCGGSSSTSTKSQNSIGYLIDAPVKGVNYECSNDNISGITDSNGKFEYTYNCNNISFKIGSTTLATINVDNMPIDGRLYITDLVEVDRNNSNNIKVINILRVLQTLDSDSDICSGIEINTTIRNIFTSEYTKEVKSFTENELQNILNDASINISNLVPPIKSLVHFEQTLKDAGINVDTVPPYKPILQSYYKTSFSHKPLYKIEGNTIVIATPNEIRKIKFKGEQNTQLFINGELNSTISNSCGYINSIDINTSQASGEYKDINITLKDDTNKTSQPLQLHILKDLNIPDFNLSITDINITSTNYQNILDINSTDYDVNATDSDCNGLVIYEVVSDNYQLFDINTTGSLSFKEKPNNGNYTITLRVTDFAKHYKDQNLTITVN